MKKQYGLDDAITAKTRAVPTLEWRNECMKGIIETAVKKIPAERRPELQYFDLEKRLACVNDYIDLHVLPTLPYYDPDDIKAIKDDFGDFACGEVDKDASDAFLV